MMKLLLTDSGVKNASIHDALVDLLGKPIAESSALCIPTAGYGRPAGDPGGPWRFISGRIPQPDDRAGVEVGGRAGAHRAAQHREGALGLLGPGGRRPAGQRRRCAVPVPLDAGVRTGRPPAVAARHGLRGAQRREHGDDPPHRGGLRRAGSRPPVATARWASSISRSSRTWITRTCRRTPWPRRNGGRPGSRVRRTRSTTQTAIKVTDGAVEVVSEGHWKFFDPICEAGGAHLRLILELSVLGRMFTRTVDHVGIRTVGRVRSITSVASSVRRMKRCTGSSGRSRHSSPGSSRGRASTSPSTTRSTHGHRSQRDQADGASSGQCLPGPSGR